MFTRWYVFFLLLLEFTLHTSLQLELENAQVIYHAHLPYPQVDEAALRNPSAVAIEADKKKMTYAALRSDSNVLARYLQFLGIDPNGKEEQIVAVVLKRSPRLVVAQLAVMKAGAASIPVDHKYPADRMEFMLSDAKCHVVITETSCMSHLPKKMPHDAVVVNLDEEWDLIRRGRDDPLPTLPSERARRRAAIIYTSGSMWCSRLLSS